MYVIIFEADTPAGKAFDVCLLIAVLVSVLVVMLETVESVEAEHRTALLLAEWSFTVLFSAEYIMRLISAPRAGSPRTGPRHRRRHRKPFAARVRTRPLPDRAQTG